MLSYAELLERLLFLEARIPELEQENVTLRSEIQRLNEQLKLTSKNSSKPPSSDRVSERQSTRKKSDLKVGGQPGHKGGTLPLTDTPDVTFTYRPISCSCCGHSLSHVPANDKPERRQVFDLPEKLSLHVTEHQGHHLVCPQCQTKNKASFPAEVRTRAQYGSRIVGLVQTLHHAHAVPYLRAAQLVSSLFGSGPCAATLVNASRALDKVLCNSGEELLAAAKLASVIHVDETTVVIDGKIYWVHVVSTDQVCYLLLSEYRGLAAMEHLKDFTGTLVHDGWQSYQLLNQASHAQCNAHHLRYLAFCAEVRQCQWATELSNLLLTSFQAVKTAKSQGLTHLPPELIAKICQQYQAIVARGLTEHPPPERPANPKPGRVRKSKERNLLERLDKNQDQTLRFTTDFNVPFDNNLAERDIRMLKVFQKVSGGFRQLWGALAHLNIRSFFQTQKRKGQNVLDAITSAISQQWINTATT